MVLSINARDLPEEVAAKQRTYRSITVDGAELEFSEGFTDLHTLAYQEILAGRGFPLEDVRPSIETVAHIRARPIEPNKGEQHPLLLKARADEQRYRYGWPV